MSGLCDQGCELDEFYIEFKFEFAFKFEFDIFIFASSSSVKNFEVFSSSKNKVIDLV